MKVFVVLAMLVAVAYCQFFCPDEGSSMDCLDGPKTKATPYCLTTGDWTCGKCGVKAEFCRSPENNRIRQAHHEAVCRSNPKPDCTAQ